LNILTLEVGTQASERENHGVKKIRVEGISSLKCDDLLTQLIMHVCYLFEMLTLKLSDFFGMAKMFFARGDFHLPTD
jgi:hypothetical protein